MNATSYTPLWCKSNYSFLEGASHPEELVEEALRLGLRSLALTDRDGVYGIVRAHMAARSTDLHLIVGSEVTLEDQSTITLLATDRPGYANLCRLLTKGRLRCEKGRSEVTWREVCEHAEGLIALWGGHASLLVANADPLFIARDLREAFDDRIYAMLTRHREPEEIHRERRLRERAKRYGFPTVASTEVLYHTRGRRSLQDVLTCIRHGVTLNTVGQLTKPNDQHALMSAVRLGMLYEDDLAAVRRTDLIAQRCTFSLQQIRYRYPNERLPAGTSVEQHLRQLAFEGAKLRYPPEHFHNGTPRDVVLQLEKELKLIQELEYDGYFLTMWEIVQFCRKNGILCQGRGSAANSAVCYCLGITAIDPVRMGLLFERFLSRERAEPPDIDLDISHERREEVIQHVYSKYGRQYAAMAANFIRYRARSAVREVGKVLELPEVEIDRLANLLSNSDAIDTDLLRTAGFDIDSPVHQHLMRLTMEIQDFPRHLSIHPGGFLLGHEPVSTLVPIENATMEDRTVIQWDKEDLENLGLFKVDLLGLGMLTVIDKSFQLQKKHLNEHFDLATIPHQDEPTFEMIRAADTIGVFQIESRAQMAMLPRLKPRTYYDLVIEISIVRPGPISGGMVHPYLRRRNGEEPVTYPHKCLEPVLRKTLGVPLFQEQVMQLAMAAADYTPGEADQLRRDMAAWRQTGKLERHRDRLITRMVQKGITPEFAERVFNQIRGFGEYGFPESHAASFALLGYASAWLKCHYPAVFACALLNSQPMGFYSPATIVDDVKRHGVECRPICVQRSQWDCTMEPCETSGEGLAMRMGFRYVKGLRADQGQRIETTRGTRPFTSLEEFAQRTRFEDATLARLAVAGAFEGIDPERRSALWKAKGMRVPRQPVLDLQMTERKPKFDSLDQFNTIAWDYNSSHHSVRGHPLLAMRSELQAHRLPCATQINELPHGRRVRYAGLVINRQRPKTAGGVVFMTLEDETGLVNLVIWKDVFRKYKILAKTSSFLGVSGKIQTEQGVTHLVVDSMWVPELSVKPKRLKSRDFH